MKEKHVVLGASGAIGRLLVQHLQAQEKTVVSVSRSAMDLGVPHVQADLLNLTQAQQAVEGASHVYLCVGLPYNTTLWQRQWPLLMDNTIAACSGQGAVLAFLDNIYMYGPPPLEVPITEEHPKQPSSIKGQIRLQVEEKLLDTFASGKLQGVIGKAADFIGPYANNSLLYPAFLERMLKGQNPQSLAPLDVQHTFANTTDIAKGLALLANTPECYGQNWHLPTCQAITIREIVQLFSQALQKDFKPVAMSPLFKKILSWFIRPLSELREMEYQFQHPYILSFTKFSKHFPDFIPSTNAEAVKAMVQHFLPMPRK